MPNIKKMPKMTGSASAPVKIDPKTKKPLNVSYNTQRKGNVDMYNANKKKK